MLLVWGSSSERILTLQKRAIRIIHNTSYLSHTDPLFKLSGILKFDDLYNITLMTSYHKLRNNQLLCTRKYLELIYHEDIHRYDTRNKIQVLLPVTRFNYLRRKIYHRVGELINSLSLSIISKFTTHSLTSILINYKTDLFNNYNKTCSGCYACRNKT